MSNKHYNSSNSKLISQPVAEESIDDDDESIAHPALIDDTEKFSSFYVKLGKIVTGGRNKLRRHDRSGVWQFFGELRCCIDSTAASSCRNDHDDSESVDSRSVLVDNTRHYCAMCLANAQRTSRGYIGLVQSYNLKTSTTPLFEHLRVAHKLAAGSEPVVGEPNIIKRPTKPSEPKNRVCKQEVQYDDDTDQVSESSTLVDPAHVNESCAEFTKWIALDFEPFSMVNNRGLQMFLSKHSTDLYIPSEAAVRENVFQVYLSLVESIKNDLATVNDINIMLDSWTDKYRSVQYLAIRVQFIRSNWQGVVVTLSVKPCPDDMQSMTHHIANELSRFVPNYASRELTVTHSGTASMISVSESLNAKNWNCCVAQSLHLLLMVDALLKVPNVASVLLKCKNIVNILHFKCGMTSASIDEELMDRISGIRSLHDVERQMAINEEFNSRRHEAGTSDMLSSCELQDEAHMQWSSSLQMIEVLVGSRPQVTNIVDQTDEFYQNFEAREWTLLEELLKFLTGFRGLADLLDSAHIISLSLITIVRAEISDLCKTSANGVDGPEIRAVKQLVVANLDKRLPSTTTMQLATLLDPSTKDLLPLTTADKELLLHEAITAGGRTSESDVDNPSISSEANTTADEGDTGCRQLSKKRKLLLKHKQFASEQTHSTQLREEICKFLLYSDDGNEDDPLVFWKLGQFPALQNLARKVLTQSAASVPVENLFSSRHLLVNSKISNLAPYRANWLAFIHDNYSVYFDS